MSWIYEGDDLRGVDGDDVVIPVDAVLLGPKFKASWCELSWRQDIYNWQIRHDESLSHYRDRRVVND